MQSDTACNVPLCLYRFQVALQAKTKFVLVMDDDVSIGHKYLHQLLHVDRVQEQLKMGRTDLSPTGICGNVQGV